MHGPPQDVDGACNAWLLLGDDYGDNTTTIRCDLPSNHEGDHLETLVREGQTARFTWVKDESVVCPTHGRKEGPECQACTWEAYEAELAQEPEPPPPPPLPKYLFEVTVTQFGFWPDRTGDAVDKSDTYTVIATDLLHAVSLTRGSCKFGEITKVERTSREAFVRRAEPVPYRFLVEGLERRMPGRSIAMRNEGQGLSLFIDGRPLLYDLLDPSSHLEEGRPMSDATDGEMLDALLKAVEAALPKESP